MITGVFCFAPEAQCRFGLNLLPSALPVFCGYFSVVVGGPYRVAEQTHRGANLRDVPLNHVPLAGSTPLKGRQADSYKYQSGRRSTANSEASPNQNPLRTVL